MNPEYELNGIRATVIIKKPTVLWSVRLRGRHVSGKTMEINADAIMSHELAREMADTVFNTIALAEAAV